jgi:hypothetical protein
MRTTSYTSRRANRSRRSYSRDDVSADSRCPSRRVMVRVPWDQRIFATKLILELDRGWWLASARDCALLNRHTHSCCSAGSALLSNACGSGFGERRCCDQAGSSCLDAASRLGRSSYSCTCTLPSKGTLEVYTCGYSTCGLDDGLTV